jgi:hypothetical protein
MIEGAFNETKVAATGGPGGRVSHFCRRCRNSVGGSHCHGVLAVSLGAQRLEKWTIDSEPAVPAHNYRLRSLLGKSNLLQAVHVVCEKLERTVGHGLCVVSHAGNPTVALLLLSEEDGPAAAVGLHIAERGPRAHALRFDRVLARRGVRMAEQDVPA